MSKTEPFKQNRVVVSYVHSKTPDLSNGYYDSMLKNNLFQIQHLKPANSLLFKFRSIFTKVFFGEPVVAKDLQMKKYELQIFSHLLVRKGFPLQHDTELTPELLNKIAKYSKSKKREYYLKLIIKRCINHMQKKLENNQTAFHHDFKLLPLTSLKNRDMFFYQYYFHEEAKKKNIPIERFFAFKNWTHRYNKNIPSSITNEVLELWKSNPRFIHEMTHYLNQGFLADFKEFNKIKIKKMVDSWCKLMKQLGEESGSEQIMKSIMARGCKLPWTIVEIEKGIKITLNVLTS
jgi:hypothetical protein